MNVARSIRRILIAIVFPTVFGVLIAFVLGARSAVSAPVELYDPGFSRPSGICAVSGTMEGVDVSRFQGTISWTQVAQTKSFAYAYARDGVSFTDTTFFTNYTQIKSAGMKAGGVLFFEPAQDPAQQADLFVAQLQQAGFSSGDLVPVIDVETTGGQVSTTIVARLQTAVDVLKSTLHVTPGIFTAPTWWDTNVGSTAFGTSPLWTADLSAACPPMPAGWISWAVWQYTDMGMVYGILGAVDLDRSYGAALPIYSGTEFSLYLPVIFR